MAVRQLRHFLLKKIMIESQPTSASALLVSIGALEAGVSRGSFEEFDCALRSSSISRGGSALAVEHLPKLDLSGVARAFERFGLLVPTEEDLGLYRLMSMFSHSRGGAPGFKVPSEHLEGFVGRVKELLREIKSAKGSLAPDPGYSRVFCGLLSYHLRYGAQEQSELTKDAAFLISGAGALQERLSAKLSTSFLHSEASWAAHTATMLLSEHDESLARLSRVGEDIVRRGKYTHAVRAMAEYVAEVFKAVNSYSEAQSSLSVRIEPSLAVNAYKYAFLLGLIDQQRYSANVVQSEGQAWIKAFDPEALQLGAVALARVTIEYDTIQRLAGRVAAAEADRLDSKLDFSSWGIESLEPTPTRAVVYEDDYWTISGPLLAARAFRRNPAATLPSLASGNAATPYLAGIDYLSTFAQRVLDYSNGEISV